MNDKRIMVIVGGSRGIGAATARLAATRGFYPVIVSSSANQQARNLAAEVGGTALACDVRDEGQVVRLFADAAALGQIGAVVYSSGITGPASPLAEASAETLRDVVAVNLTGALLCAREAVRHMSTARGGAGGSITFISSRASDRGSSGEYVWYAATKGGVNSLAIGLAREVGREGIRVNCVSPGPIATEMLTPERQQLGGNAVAMGRVGLPEEVASAVLYLASDEASYITAANLAVAGGA
jgi:NAD(P)-dependent dehydrogenase (short-subunit alcohol dehydrogenase family)